MGVTASAAAWSRTCSNPEQPVSDGFKGDGGKCGKREVLDTGDGCIPLGGAFCIERGSGKKCLGQVEGANADGRRSWGSE